MYTVYATVQRLVTELWEVTLDEDIDPDTALDHVFEHMSMFPDSELPVKTRRRLEEQTEHCTVIDVEHLRTPESGLDKREEANDSTERVFNEDEPA